MKRSQSGTEKPARNTAALKRAAFVTAAILLIGLIAFAEIIRPNQDAKSYSHRLETASQPLEKCYLELADTTGLQLYYAPDVDLQIKKKDIGTINSEIVRCRQDLAGFTTASQQLLTLHLAGYTKTYQEARVKQRQAVDVIGQSTDVLNQYSKLMTFLSSYYNHIEAFTSYNAALTNGNGYFYSDRIQLLATQAKDMHSRATQVRQLASPTEFNATKEATASMLDTSADGFSKLVVGYSQGNDYTVEAGYKQIDQATAMYDSTVINLPFDQLIKSYIPKQVTQLPVKVENLLAGSVE